MKMPIPARLFFMALALLAGLLFPGHARAGVSIQEFQIAYTGNTEVEVALTIAAGTGEQLCPRLDLYRNNEKIRTLPGAGTHQVLDEGLAKGASLTYRAELYDTCNLDNGLPAWKGSRQEETVAGNIAGAPSRDLTWSGGTWNLTGNVTLSGKSLTISGGAEVNGGGAWSIRLFQGAAAAVNGAALRNVSVRGPDYTNENTSVRVLDSTLENAAITVDTFHEFRNNTLVNVPSLAFRPNSAALDIRNLVAPATAVSVSWVAATPPPSITFEGNRLKSLYIDNPATSGDLPNRSIAIRQNTLGEALTVAAGTGTVEIQGNSAASIVVSGPPGASPVVPPPKTGIADFKRFIRGNTLTPVGTVQAGRAIELSSFYGSSANEFYVEGNTVTCAAGSNGRGIYLAGGASYNWILRNSVEGCLYGMALEGGSGRISANLIEDNSLTGNRTSWGIRLYQDAVGNTMAGNAIRKYLQGLSLIGSGPDNGTNLVTENVFTANTVEDNDTAVNLSGAARDNRFYNNLFRKRDEFSAMVSAASNTCKDAQGSQILCPNTWNTDKTPGVSIAGGPYLGGNGWSDFGGTDADRDGLGDVPYTIDAANRDLLPLVFDLLVNRAGDEEDADPDDGKCDVDLAAAGEQCTLRAALTEANRRPGENRISFAIPATGTPVIAPASPLPAVTEPLVLNGASQPGGRVIVDGTNAGTTADGIRFPTVDSDLHYGVKGMTFRKFGGSGLLCEGNLDLREVEATDNGAFGAVSRFSIGIEGTGNLFSRNGLAGLYSTFGDIEAGRATLAAENNGWQGIAADGGSVTLNWVAGIPPYPFQRSRVTGNGRTGIYVSRDENWPIDGFKPDPTGYLTAMFIDVTGNGAAGTDDAGQSGIYAENGVDLTSAAVDDNAGYGVASLGEVSLHITPNSFSRNGKDGIVSLRGGIYAGDATLQALANGGRGIYAGRGSVEINTVAGKPPYPFEKSQVTGNGRTGILVKRDPSLKGDDLKADPTGHLAAMFLEVSDNGGAGTTNAEKSGIWAEGHVDLTASQASGNIGQGVLALKDIGLYGEGNVFSHNGGSGIISEFGGVFGWDAVVQAEYNGRHGISAGRGSVAVNWVLQTGGPAHAGAWSLIRGNGLTGILAKSNDYTGEERDPGNVTAHYLKVLSNLGAGLQAAGRITVYQGQLCDNRGGNFSAPETVFAGVDFCDSDLDGVSDAIEALAPNNGDGNGDGTADAQQAGAASLVSLGKVVTVASEGTTKPLLSVTVNDEFPATGPKGVAFQSGVVEALLDVGGGRLPQDGAPVVHQVRQILHGATGLSVYWVFGPTAANPLPHWYAFPFTGTTGARFEGNTVILSVIDGGDGDSDGQADGRITLIGAAGNPEAGFNEHLTGDINRDGVVDLQDAILALQVLAGGPGAGVRYDYAASGVDVDGDHRIGHPEALYSLQRAAGLMH
jgi:hypothetical protein